jgi:hypothetical protein
MGTIGDALDNAMAESFFSTLQAELASAIFSYIEGSTTPTADTPRSAN